MNGWRGAIVVALGAWAWLGCSFDWDALDPRGLAAGGGAGGLPGTGGGGAGGSGGGGGDGCPGDGLGGALALTFSDPVAIPELAAEGFADDDPSFTSDRRELYFNSNRSGEPFQTFRSTRLCPGDPWGAPAEVLELSTPEESTTPRISPNGLVLLLSYGDLVNKQFDIFMSIRATRDEPWPTPEAMPELNTVAPDRPNWVSDDGLRAGLDSDVSGAGDLFVAERGAVGDSWPVPAPLDDLNTTLSELSGWQSPDRLTIYFAGAVTGRGSDLFRARRAAPTDPWGPREALDELNTDENENDPWVSPDERYIMFSRSVDGNPRIFHASR